MNLIDVVWESLIYFGIAAIAVILISWVSFKLRRKLTGEKFAYEKEIEKKQKKIKAVKEAQKKAAEEKKAAKSKPKKIHTHASDKVRIKQKLKTGGHHRELKNLEKKKIKFSQKDRLEILNPTEKIATHSSGGASEKSRTKETKTRKNLHSLNTNVIEKYSEDEEEFYTIKVKKDKKE